MTSVPGLSLGGRAAPFPYKAQGPGRKSLTQENSNGSSHGNHQGGKQEEKHRAKRITKEKSQHLSKSLLPRSEEGDLGSQSPYSPGYSVVGFSHSDIPDLGILTLDS